MTAAGDAGAGLAAQIREAEARLAFLKSRIGAVTCAEMGEHDWQFIGGRNASCEDERCACSVPVYQCSRCKDCDYGDNAEAAEVRQECADVYHREQQAEARIRAARTAGGTDAGRA